MRYVKFILFLFLLCFLFGCAATLTKLQQQRLDILENDAAQVLVEAQQKMEEHPDSALGKNIELLNSILDYSDAIRSDPEKFSEEKIREYSTKIQIYRENINNYLELKMDSDISFDLGKYEMSGLTDQAKVAMDDFTTQLLSSLKEKTKKYSGYNISVYLKVVGYTDETPFRQGTELEKKILERLDGRKPENEIERRKMYNQILSELRAETLIDYICAALKRKIPGIEINKNVVGAGEKFPREDISVLYESTDKRRRVCIISPLIEIE